MYSENFQLPSGARLPEPQGYRVLIMTAVVEEKTAGGILRPSQNTTPENTASMVGKVMKKGPLAYKDQDKFPTGDWCQEGDLVMFKSFSGIRFDVAGREFRLINDDTIEATVPDLKQLVRK